MLQKERQTFRSTPGMYPVERDTAYSLDDLARALISLHILFSSAMSDTSTSRKSRSALLFDFRS